MANFDWSKAFIVGMSVIIVGLSAAIVMNYMKVKTYEDAFRVAKTDYYGRLAEAVEQAKVFEAREKEGERVDLDNPNTYIETQKRAASISEGFDVTPSEDTNSRGRFVDTTFKITLDQPIDRERLADFLFRLESGSSLLKISRLEMRHSSKKGEDLWEPSIYLGYRKTLVR